MTAKCHVLFIALAGLLSIQQASAICNPQTGRWLSRDPVDEPGFQLVHGAYAPAPAASRVALSPGRFFSRDPLNGNLYIFACNSSINFLDALGLLVVGAFDIGTGVLTITDSDTGETIVLCAESGGKPYGDPIPTGEFEILDHPDNNFFRLDPVDEVPRNDIHEPTKRDKFRLHKPGRTIGCIAAKIECGDCWSKVVDMIRKTKTEDVQVTTQRTWPRGPITETIKKFGDFRVIDTSKNSVPGEKFNPCKCTCGHENK